MKIAFRITDGLLTKIRKDLSRKHSFALERVGFIGCRAAELTDDGLIITANQYFPVEDGDYLDDPRVGAMMGPGAIRKALQHAYSKDLSMFHVHMHEHKGFPRFSRIDLAENAKFVPDFWNVRPLMPHGALVLSHDQLNGLCWVPGTREIKQFSDLIVASSPLTRIWRA